MRVHTLWKMWDDEGIELLFAADEHVVEANWEYWEHGCKAAREKYGIQPEDTREVVIDVPYSEIAATFYPPELPATVVAPDKRRDR